MNDSISVKNLDSKELGPFRLDEVEVTFPHQDGSVVQRRVCFERGQSVSILLHRKDKDVIVLAKQFRYPVYSHFGREEGQGWLLELPAGIVPAEETTAEAAQRELLEEVGYGIEEYREIFTFFPSPGGSSEQITIMFAEVSNGPTQKGGGVVEDGEAIEIVEIATSDFIRMALTNQIQDAKTLIAGLWLANRV